MTHNSIVRLLTGTLAALALSANGAGASRAVKPKVHLPQVAVYAPKENAREIRKETDSSSSVLFRKTLNVDSAPLRKIADSPTKSKKGGTKGGGVVIRKETDSATPSFMRKTLTDPNHQ
jgi:hypothetical protein